MKMSAKWVFTFKHFFRLNFHCLTYSAMILNRSLHKEERTELKVDMGRQKDAWMELYGNSVLNNTLQVLIKRHWFTSYLSKVLIFFNIRRESSSTSWRKASQLCGATATPGLVSLRPLSMVTSACWALVNFSASGPVMSTDKLEKPKHHHSQQGTTHQTNSNPLSAPSTGSLPRRNANGVFYRTPQDFVGGSQQSNLRRNCSMNDLQQRNQDDQSSWLPAPPPQVQESQNHAFETKNGLTGWGGLPSPAQHGPHYCHHCSSKPGFPLPSRYLCSILGSQCSYFPFSNSSCPRAWQILLKRC